MWPSSNRTPPTPAGTRDTDFWSRRSAARPAHPRQDQPGSARPAAADTWTGVAQRPCTRNAQTSHHLLEHVGSAPLGRWAQNLALEHRTGGASYTAPRPKLPAQQLSVRPSGLPRRARRHGAVSAQCPPRNAVSVLRCPPVSLPARTGPTRTLKPAGLIHGDRPVHHARKLSLLMTRQVDSSFSPPRPVQFANVS